MQPKDDSKKLATWSSLAGYSSFFLLLARGGKFLFSGLNLLDHFFLGFSLFGCFGGFYLYRTSSSYEDTKARYLTWISRAVFLVAVVGIVYYLFVGWNRLMGDEYYQMMSIDPSMGE